MALFGGGGDWKKAYRREMGRLRRERIAAQKREVWQTKEGQGISERANISLGYDDEEEDELQDERDARNFSSSGLMI